MKGKPTRRDFLGASAAVTAAGAASAFAAVADPISAAAELALPNASWFEVPSPAELSDHPYFSYKFRPDKDGFIPAPTNPGLGYPIDYNALSNITTRIDRGTA